MRGKRNFSSKRTQKLLKEPGWTLDTELARRLPFYPRFGSTVYQNADGRVLLYSERAGSCLYESREAFLNLIEAIESGSSRRKTQIEQRRGNDCSDVNDILVLVQSQIASVAPALNQILPLENWEQDMYGYDIEIKNKGFIVFQFQGHSWTCIHDYGYQVNFNSNTLQLLSQLLHTRVIYSTVSDTSGMTAYDFYDCGELMEKLYFESGHPFQFESRLRSFEAENDEDDDEDLHLSIGNLVSDFWHEQPDIYVPAIVRPKLQAGQRVTFHIQAYGPETFERNNFERVDYMVLRETMS